MQFKDIVGQRVLINRLTDAIDTGRVSHAQMLLGPMGYGTGALVVAYVQYLMCENRQHFGADSNLRADSCGECPNCKKIQALMHPDVHFFFPTTTNGRVKKDPSSSQFRDEFHQFLLENKFYATIQDWYIYSGAENKQGQYRVLDSDEMMHSMVMKSYEGGMKVFILWMPELMGPKVSNELLKSLEEPYENTLIMLAAEKSETMLSTVLSRVQTIRVPRITDVELPDEAEGDYITARQMTDDYQDFNELKNKFVEWMRLLFKLNMESLGKWVEAIATIGREKQKVFLKYVMDAVGRCFSQTAGAMSANLNTGDERFDTMFPNMVTTRNVTNIYEALNEAYYSVERNVNPKVLFMNLSFQLSRHIKNR